MELLPVLIITVGCYLNALQTHGSVILPKSVEDHYWRDFHGLVPTCAIQGGKDRNGITTYIGQFSTVAEYGLEKSTIHTIPATIKTGNEVAYAPYMGRTIFSNSSSNVKVLCISYATRYKWYTSTSIFPPGCRFVVAGYEDKSPMYIGRATHNTEVITGKIFADTSNHGPGLIVPYEGGELYPTSYEILTYCY